MAAGAAGQRGAAAALALLLLAAALAGCAGRQLETVRQAGSSTVLPVALAWAEVFEAKKGNVSFVVSGGGTGSGFKQFCRGELHIADASRRISSGEERECAASNITPFRIPVAIDAIAVVVSTENAFVQNLTVRELHRIWTANASAQANRWSDLRPGWPDQPIQRYGPGTDSGTFDYFVEAVIHPVDGKPSKGRSDYTPSEDDNVLVQGVRASPFALGYFGLAYAHQNADSLRVLPIDGGEGPVHPTDENVEGGDYTPLSRAIYMYTDGAPRGLLREYFEFGLGPEGQGLVQEVGYIRLPGAQRAAVVASLEG